MASQRGFFQQSSNNIFVNPEELYPPSPAEQPSTKKARGNKDGVLPWRKQGYRQQMFLTLSRLIIVHSAHLGKQKEKSDNWEKVNADLWKQDIFKDYPPVEIRQVKSSWQTWVRDRMRFHAWDSGIPANNSDKADDLDEADKNLLLILTEEEAQREKARALKADKEMIEKNEITLVTEGISAEAKKRRSVPKLLATREPTSSVTNSSSSHFDFGARLDAMMQKMTSPDAKAVMESLPPSTPIEMKTLKKFEIYFQWMNDAQILQEAAIEGTEENFKVMQRWGIKIFIDVFCARDKRYDRAYVVNEYRAIVDSYFAFKMYAYLNRLENDMENTAHVASQRHIEVANGVCLGDDYSDYNSC